MDEWDDEHSMQTGSVYGVDSSYASDPTIIRQRGIGFGADIRRPVYRVKAKIRAYGVQNATRGRREG